MKKTFITLISAIILLVSCQKSAKKEITTIKETPKTVEVASTFSQKIEIAHKKKSFLKQEAIQYNAVIEFGGNEIFNAKITISTTSDLAIISYKNGDEIYVKKENIFVSPNLKDDKRVRFNAYTWNYFFLYPYKLSDNGTIWDDHLKTNEKENIYDTAKLSFKENIGDAPDDWYILYKDAKTNMLAHVAYVVTLGTTKEAAEKNPHAIKYLDYKTINGIPFATTWEFYGWNLEDGLTDKIGSAKITDIKFVSNFRESFKVPVNYIAK